MTGEAVVYVTVSQPEAAVIKSLLESRGIYSRVRSDDCGGVRPALAFAGGIEIIVSIEDREQAEIIINQYENGDFSDNGRSL